MSDVEWRSSLCDIIDEYVNDVVGNFDLRVFWLLMWLLLLLVIVLLLLSWLFLFVRKLKWFFSFDVLGGKVVIEGVIVKF